MRAALAFPRADCILSLMKRAGRRRSRKEIANQTHIYSMALKNAPDLTQHPPRSPRVRLGGYVILPRMLDKGRATIAGKHGEYHYDCPTGPALPDLRRHQRGRAQEAACRRERATAKSCSGFRRTRSTSARRRRSPPGRPMRTARAGGHRIPRVLPWQHAKIAPKREDIATWFDLLDLDDYVSFGGKANQ